MMASLLMNLWPGDRRGVRSSFAAIGVLAAALVFSATPVALAADTAADPRVPADLGARLAQDYAVPATARLAERAARLERSVAGYCQPGAAADGRADAAALERDFRDTVLAWAGVEFLRFGPLVEANRYERIAFWPDPRGVMQRQVQGLLAASETATLDAGTLAGRSVAMQGLPALEFVLYRDAGLLAATAPDANECAYARALTGALAEVSGEVAAAWSAQHGFGGAFTQPGAAKERYRSQREVAAEAIKALSGGLQFARDIKLAPLLAEPPSDSRARRAPFWRSGLTIPAMMASAQGLLDFYAAARWPLDATATGIDQSLRHELTQWRLTLQDLPAEPVAVLLSQADTRARLHLLLLILKNAKDLVDQDLAAHLGIAVGFNALDGD